MDAPILQLLGHSLGEGLDYLIQQATDKQQSRCVWVGIGTPGMDYTKLKRSSELGVVEHTSNPSTEEAEAGRCLLGLKSRMRSDGHHVRLSQWGRGSIEELRALYGRESNSGIEEDTKGELRGLRPASQDGDH